MKYSYVVFLLTVFVTVPVQVWSDDFQDFENLPEGSEIPAREEQAQEAPQFKDFAQAPAESAPSPEGQVQVEPPHEAVAPLPTEPVAKPESQAVVENQNEKSVESDVKESIEAATNGSDVPPAIPIAQESKAAKNESVVLKDFYKREKSKKIRVAKIKADKKKLKAKQSKHAKLEKKKKAKYLAKLKKQKNGKKIALKRSSGGRAIASIDKPLPKKQRKRGW